MYFIAILLALFRGLPKLGGHIMSIFKQSLFFWRNLGLALAMICVHMVANASAMPIMIDGTPSTPTIAAAGGGIYEWNAISYQQDIGHSLLLGNLSTEMYPQPGLHALGFYHSPSPPITPSDIDYLLLINVGIPVVQPQQGVMLNTGVIAINFFSQNLFPLPMEAVLSDFGLTMSAIDYVPATADYCLRDSGYTCMGYPYVFDVSDEMHTIEGDLGFVVRVTLPIPEPAIDGLIVIGLAAAALSRRRTVSQRILGKSH